MWRDCTIRVAKTKALITCAVTVQLICVFVFAYEKSRFSHYEAHMALTQLSDMRIIKLAYSSILVKTLK